jgi:hypothetical protein
MELVIELEIIHGLYRYLDRSKWNESGTKNNSEKCNGTRNAKETDGPSLSPR